MSGMTTSDWRKVSDLVRRFHEAGQDMPAGVLADVGALIGCDVASYNSVDHVRQQLVHSVTVPHTLTFFGVFSFHRIFEQHPGFVAYRDGRLRSGQAAAWSDLMDRRALRRLPLFVDFFQPRGTEDQLLAVVRVQPRHGGVLAFNRARRGFTGRERDIVETLAAHLSLAVAHRERVARLTVAVRRSDQRDRRTDRAAVRLPTLTARERDVVTYALPGAT